MTAEYPDGTGALRAEIARLEAQLARDGEAARLERDRLTYELSHRVKNTLSAVQALAGQTLRGAASSDEAFEAFGDRILAMARANDAILKDSWTTASVEDTARSVLLPHGTAPGSLTIEGPPLRLRASAALSFAMALHELSTNARRFGAWSRPGGRVALCWQTPATADGQFELSWTEDGGPAPTMPDKRGFGRRLAEQSLRSAFGRDVHLDFGADGLVVRVRAPLGTVEA